MKIVQKLENWAPVLTLTGLALIATLLIVSGLNTIYLITIVIGSACVTLYIFFQQYLDDKKELSFKGNFWFYSAITFMGGALLSWLIRPDQYTVPLIYFILMALSAGFLFVYAVSGGKATAIVVTSCCMVAMHIFTTNLLFPGMLGIDPWSHMFTTTHWLDLAGTGPKNPPLTLLNMGGSYSLMHVYLREIINLTHLEYRIASLVFWSAPLTIGSIVMVYLIGSRLWSSKIGSVAAILAANAGWIIFFGQWSIPNSAGATFSLLIAFIFIYCYQSGRRWPLFLIPAVLSAAILTNVVVTVWVTGTIIVSSVLLIHKNWKMILMTPTVAAVLLVWYKISSMKSALSTVVDSQLSPTASLGNLTYPIGSAPVISVPASTSYVPVNPSATLVNQISNTSELLTESLGMFLFLGLALAGLLILVRGNLISKYWAIFCAVTTLAGIIPQIFGLSVLEHRWFYLSEALMAIPLAIILVRAVKSKITLGIVAAAVACLTFLSIMGAPSNTTNRALSPDLTVRYGFTAAELQGLDAARVFNAHIIGSDPLYALFLNTTTDYYGKVNWIDREIVLGDFSGCKADTLLLRDSLHTEPFGYGSGTIYSLQFDPVEVAQKQGYTEVWKNSDIHLLMRR